MTKRTYKLRQLGGDIDAAIASTPNLSAAARKLGVNRSSLQRWIKAGKVAAPMIRTTRRLQAATVGLPRPGQSPKAWARYVRRKWALSATDLALLTLAERMYAMSTNDAQPAAIQVSAAGRFLAILARLDLEEESSGEAEDQKADVRQFPRRLG